MKKIFKYLLSAISFILLTAAKNPIKTSALLTSTGYSQRWYVTAGLNATDTLWDVFQINNRAQKLMVGVWRTDNQALNSLDIYTNIFRLDSFNVRRNDGVPVSLLWVDNTGAVKRSPASSFTLTSTQVTDAVGVIPAAQVNSDWNSVSGVSQVLNKPTIIPQVTQTMVAGASMSVATGVNSFTFINTAPDQTVALTGANGLTVTGTYPTFTVTQKRQLKYSGTTDGSGNITATFSPSFAVTPNMQVCLINPNVRDTPVPTISATGFTVNVQRRTDVLGILPTYANVVGGTVHILVSEN